MTNTEALRTPDDRFDGLVDFPFPPNYVEDLPGYSGLRAHYLDLGPRDADRTFLCLHGEPTWAYLYRKMIPPILESGARVIAPDFFGFGRSDKPQEARAYTFSFHRQFLLRLVRHLELRNITLVVQDWGGTLGLTLPLDQQFRDRLDRLLVMNTVLPVGEPLGAHYYEWRALVRNTPDPPIGEWMRQAAPTLTSTEIAGYDAPFPDVRFKAGPKTFPDLAMVEPGMEGVGEAKSAVRFWREEWSGQSVMIVGGADSDVGAIKQLHADIRNCPRPITFADAGHFVQEKGAEVAYAALRAFGGE